MLLSRFATLLPAFCLVLALSADAHEGHDHENAAPATQEDKLRTALPDAKWVYGEIQLEYMKGVQAIFAAKCAPCHSKQIASPWYAQLPGVGWFVESDRTQAKVHLEIAAGFPFAGHGSPQQDLMAIHDSLAQGTMPTRLYVFFHPSSRVSDDEKKVIFEWIENSQKRLAELKPDGAMTN